MCYLAGLVREWRIMVRRSGAPFSPKKSVRPGGWPSAVLEPGRSDTAEVVESARLR